MHAAFWPRKQLVGWYIFVGRPASQVVLGSMPYASSTRQPLPSRLCVLAVEINGDLPFPFAVGGASAQIVSITVR